MNSKSHTVRSVDNTEPKRMTAKHIALIGVSLVALAASGCKHTDEANGKVAGWTLVDAAQRHPIIVSQKPSTLNIAVHRGSRGLSPRQRAELLDFAARYRASDAGDSRLVIAAPSGGANEVSAMHAVHEVRGVLEDEGFAAASIAVEAYSADGGNAPIRVSYLRYVAEAPECGAWPTNIGHDPGNAPYANFGCATQRNLAVQVANPADLLGPRTMTSRSSERRDVVYDKYVKGEVTTARKTEDEKVKTQGN
ncbi:MAG: CpaD family pilus assembly protein [Hyphomicrobiaceae bacterium]